MKHALKLSFLLLFSSVLLLSIFVIPSAFAGYVTTNGKVYADDGITYNNNNYQRYGSVSSQQRYSVTRNSYGTSVGSSQLHGEFVRNGYGTSSATNSYGRMVRGYGYFSYDQYGSDYNAPSTHYKVYRTPVNHKLLSKYYNYNIKVYQYNNNEYEY